jgi:hypothetical protein
METRIQASESPYQGAWKVIALPPGRDVTLWIVEISEQDGKPHARIVAPQTPQSTVTFAKADDVSLRIGIKTPFLTYTAVGYRPKDSSQPQQLLGSLEARGRRDMLRMERTTATELPPGGTVTPMPAAEALAQADSLRNPPERERAFRDVMSKFQGQSAAFHAALELTALAAEAGAPDLELRARAEHTMKTAAPYGREMELQAALQVARQFARGERQGVLAVDYARKAQKLLADDDPPMVQVRVLRTLGLALRKTGQSVAARPLEARADQLDEALDKEYEQGMLPFATEAFSGRKTLSDRVVAVELFTSSSCPFCVAADSACAGLDKSFGRKDLAILAYHLPAPLPDPLANRDSEERAAFYRVQTTAALLINGKLGPVVGGSIIEAKDRYDDLRKAILPQLEVLSPIRLKVSAVRRGDKVDILTEASDLPASETLRLRLALLEEKVRRFGPNGQRLHFHVVRALLGGAAGTPLRNKTVRESMTISLQSLSRSLHDYLAKFAPIQTFLEDERPMELRGLKVVALVQDDKTREILQVAQADVAEK